MLSYDLARSVLWSLYQLFLVLWHVHDLQLVLVEHIKDNRIRPHLLQDLYQIKNSSQIWCRSSLLTGSRSLRFLEFMVEPNVFLEPWNDSQDNCPVSWIFKRLNREKFVHSHNMFLVKFNHMVHQICIRDSKLVMYSNTTILFSKCGPWSLTRLCYVMCSCSWSKKCSDVVFKQPNLPDKQ